MTRTADITSFTDFHAHLREYLNQRRATDKPLFVTTDGETEAVVLSPAAFEELMDRADSIRNLPVLDRGIEDVKAGRGQPLKQAVRDVAEELGLKLDR